MEFLSDIASLINSTLRISTPLVFAAMAGIFAERSGVIDFSLEGKMLMAAFVAAVGSYYLGNPWLGLLLAIIEVSTVISSAPVATMRISDLAISLSRFLIFLTTKLNFPATF